ncbi:MAG: hypothetical protein KAQ71_04255, partial [Desulfobulbaceae bacterium]|nr:hypothetical protein [Desulfobulbaceae bacterium]
VPGFRPQISLAGARRFIGLITGASPISTWSKSATSLIKRKNKEKNMHDLLKEVKTGETI